MWTLKYSGDAATCRKSDMFLPELKRVRDHVRVVDKQHGMTLYVPDDPKGRARLTVNPSEAFDEDSFRSRRVDRATVVVACPINRWERKRCSTGMVSQAFHYRAGERNRVTRDFFSGRLQKRHAKDQERLREAQK